ncbi:spore germination protein [Cohnella pontilimi]|uniref:Spore germination protein n=1 Tax=Cohnella pontilimi TaxID=2564100 RepID=A0A4U0FGF7_9BACL|nr:spore germination protein [Cohnella pontilimi]TJY44007.1 spore germination protein [Cohnella pontilimi]
MRPKKGSSNNESDNGSTDDGTSQKETGTRYDTVEFEFLSELDTLPLSDNLEENKKFLKRIFTDCSDVVNRPFTIEKDIPALALFVDGLVKTELVENALENLMIFEGREPDVESLMSRSLPVSQVKTTENYGEFLEGVLNGDTGILLHSNAKGLLLGIRGPAGRSVNEPETEGVVRGPREGFTENLRINTSLIRRRIKSPHMKTKPFVLGRRSQTPVALIYVEGLTNPGLIEEAIGRIEKIDVDIMVESGFLEEFIQDNAFSPFPQMQVSERPDTVAIALMNGRIAIVIDGTPMVLLLPTTFYQLLQASEDYYERFQMGTLIRWLRYVFLFISLFMPGLYVAITTYHAELIPTTLLFSIASAREHIPFPAVVEALIMEVTFEALREAGIRLPKAVGSAVGILGALVVGQAAVEAGIVSAPMVIVVAITGIASFTIPSFNGAIALRMLRFPFIVMGAMFGVYGILIALMILIGHMANLRSFGVPYLSPIGPMNPASLTDVFIRSPNWSIQRRPGFLNVLDDVRVKGSLTKSIWRQRGQKGIDVNHGRNDESSGDGQDEK